MRKQFTSIDNMPPEKQHHRFYRNLVQHHNLVNFRVSVKETDLFVQACQNLANLTRDLVLKYRGHIEAYIRDHPLFGQTLNPYPMDEPAPSIIRDMAWAGEMAGVGPMAAVAGAISEHVGQDLLSHSDEIVIENGGDVFIKTNAPLRVGIFAAGSPLSLRIAIQTKGGGKPISVCTSSGKIGHSLSFGRADAVCAVSVSCSLADAAATATANRIRSKSDIQRAIDFGKTIEGISGLVAIADADIGIWGDLEVVPLDVKKG